MALNEGVPDLDNFLKLSRTSLEECGRELTGATPLRTADIVLMNIRLIGRTCVVYSCVLTQSLFSFRLSFAIFSDFRPYFPSERKSEWKYGLGMRLCVIWPQKISQVSRTVHARVI